MGANQSGEKKAQDKKSDNQSPSLPKDEPKGVEKKDSVEEEITDPEPEDKSKPLYDDVITLPASCFPEDVDLIVLDKGYSMIKILIGHRSGDSVRFVCRTYRVAETEAALSWVLVAGKVHADSTVRVTGSGADVAKPDLEERLKCSIETVDEFFALKRGAELLLRYGEEDEVFYPNPELLYESKKPRDENLLKSDLNEEETKFPTLYIDIGSASGATWISEEDVNPLTSGCLLGGKAFLGLANLLLDTINWEEINRLALQGTRGNVDLLGGEVFEECDDASYQAFPKEMTIFHFGKLTDSLESKTSISREDKAAALVGLFVEFFCTYAHTSLSKSSGQRVVIGGNFTRSEYFRRDCYSRHKATDMVHGGKEMKFMKTGHVAAFGALVQAVRTD